MTFSINFPYLKNFVDLHTLTKTTTTKHTQLPLRQIFTWKQIVPVVFSLKKPYNRDHAQQFGQHYSISASPGLQVLKHVGI